MTSKLLSNSKCLIEQSNKTSLYLLTYLLSQKVYFVSQGTTSCQNISAKCRGSSYLNCVQISFNVRHNLAVIKVSEAYLWRNTTQFREILPILRRTRAGSHTRDCDA